MGAGNSKQAPEASQHVFAADSPVRFSHDLVESLQKSPQTDSIRSKALELHIQSRITSELEKLHALESARLNDLSTELPEGEQASSVFDSISEHLSGAAPAQHDAGRETVVKQIAELRTKLAGRKKLEQADPSVEAARGAVVKCLREHDRRPLNCWEEVEAFRREVGRMEKQFVDRTVRS